MSQLTKAQQAEREEARERLRAILPPGATVYTVLRHVARSGMSRSIDVYLIDESGPHWLSRLVSRATGLAFDKKREAVKMGGWGMDMGFAIVANLGHALYPDGFGCIGEGCPSNDHSNGDRDYSVHGERTMLSCRQRVCTCHDPSAWTNPNTYPMGCLSCGCRRASHWHKSGDYALRHWWM